MTTCRALSLGLLALWLSVAPARAISVVTAPDADDDPTLDASQLLGTTTYPWTVTIANNEISGQPGAGINEAAVAAVGQTVIVGYNNTGLHTNNVGYAISADNGATWSTEYTPVTLRNPYRSTLIYSSDPSVAQCVDAYGHTKLLAGSVAFNNDFTRTLGALQCDADNAFILTGTIDRGVRWDRTHAVDAGPGLFRDRPVLACDAFSARCWAMFNGYSALPDGSGICDEHMLGPSLYVATSNDCGDTWTLPIPVNYTHEAATNLVVLRNGHARFALFHTQFELQVWDCDPVAGCTILDRVLHNATAVSGGDHAHVQGLLKTRLNSMPVTACKGDGSKCSVAWVNEFGTVPLMPTVSWQALIQYITTTDGGATWTAPALIPQWNTFHPDQVLPVLAWGYTMPGLCWYQREALVGNAGDHRMHMLCSASTDNGLTWAPPDEVADPVDLSTDLTLGVNSFLGDYNQLDGPGGWFAFTGIRFPPATGTSSTLPIVRLARWAPDRYGCEVGPASPGGAWLLLAPLALLAARRWGRGWCMAGALLGLLACPLQARAGVCMGDCNGDGVVQIHEVIGLINVALATAPIASCPVATHCDDTPGQIVGIFCVVQAVNAALDGCPVEATPTPP